MIVATASLNETLADNVRREMFLRGWTQHELAARCGISQPRISALFRGEYGSRLETVEKIAKAFGVSPLALLSDAG